MIRLLASRVPILMYHRIAEPAYDHAKAGWYAVPPRLFAAHMWYLHIRRYQPITVARLADCMQRRSGLPRRTVVITFDDGYTDTYTHALPVLRRYGFGATVYPVSGMIGGRNQWDEAESMPTHKLMDLTQIMDLAKQGIEIGAHTLTHRHLAMIPVDDAAHEIRESKAALERLIGYPVCTFCYPYGPTSINEQTRQIVIDSGFSAACGTFPAANYIDTDRYQLNRLWPKAGTCLPLFASMLCGR